MQAWGEGTSNAGTGGTGAGEGDGVPATTNDATWLDTFYDPTNPQFWTTAGGTFSSTVSATTSVNGVAFYSWNSSGLTADVQSWVNQSTTNFGWIVIGNETTARTAKQFDTRENTTAADRPTLVVTYTAPPTVTSVNPNTGPAMGGTSVIVSGTGFTGATSVHFGAAAATSFIVSSDTQITAIDPAGSGVVDVTVTVPVGGTSATSTADQFTYVQPAPTISSVVINQDIATLYNAAGQPFAGAQRSMVNDIVYTFSEPVSILDPGSDPNVFSVAVASGWTGSVPTLSWAPVAGSGNSEWAVSFSGNGVTGGSIANGAYTITVTDPASITAESDGQALTVTPGLAPGTGNPAYATQQFYRLFGDINGDEFVNAADNVKFKQALTTYNAAFDYTQDGFVNAADNIKFKSDLTVNFSGFSPTI